MSVGIDYDFRHIYKMAIVGGLLLVCLWQRNFLAILMVGGVAYYARESHLFYLQAKSYNRLKGHLKIAVKN